MRPRGQATNKSCTSSRPAGNTVWDDAGNLYGTATSGDTNCGPECGNGTIFKLSPSGNGWKFETIHFFSGPDGSSPMSLFRDSTGNLYDSTGGGGKYGYGTVYKLSPSDKGWSYKDGVIYAFSSTGGHYPSARKATRCKISHRRWLRAGIFNGCS